MSDIQVTLTQPAQVQVSFPSPAPESLDARDASNSRVKSTGSTTYRILADRFAEVVNVKDFGAVGDGATDDSAAINAAITSGGANAVILIPASDSSYLVKTQLTVTNNNVTILLYGATLDNTAMTGSGTSDVHDTNNVLATFKVTGNNVKIFGGHLTGATSSGSLQLLGVLFAATSFGHIRDTKFSSMYCGVWTGGNATDTLLENVEVSACSRNLLFGYMPTTSTSPQATRSKLLYCNSHDSTIGDGVKFHTFTFHTQIIGGTYKSNGNNGIDGYVGGEEVVLIGVESSSNTQCGVVLKQQSQTGSTAGLLGFGRRCKVIGCTTQSNGAAGVQSVLGVDYTLGSNVGVPGMIISNNYSSDNGSYGFDINLDGGVFTGNISERNTLYGAYVRSCYNTNLSDNQFIDNGSDGCRFGVSYYTGAVVGVRNLIRGNRAYDTRSGGSRTQVYGFEVDLGADNLFSNNYGYNNTTSDFLITSVAGTTLWLDNVGAVNSSSVAVLGEFSGTGSPESAVTANIGSRYRRLDGGASTSLYIKTSGTGNTGWTAK